MDERTARNGWTEKDMLEYLEFAKNLSKDCPSPIYVMGDGKRLRGMVEFTYKKEGNDLRNQGFWMVAIFEHGCRVEA